MALKFDMSKNNWQDTYMRQMQMQSPTGTYLAGKNIGEGLGLLGGALHDRYGPARQEYKKYEADIDAENITLKAENKTLKPKLPFGTWRTKEWAPERKAEKKVKRQKRREDFQKWTEPLTRPVKNVLATGLGGAQDFVDKFKDSELNQKLKGIGEKIKDKPWQTIGSGLTIGGLGGAAWSALNPQQRVGTVGIGVLGAVLNQVLDPEDLRKNWDDIKDKFAGLPDDIKGGLKEKYNNIKSEIKGDKLTPWNDEWLRGFVTKNVLKKKKEQEKFVDRTSVSPHADQDRVTYEEYSQGKTPQDPYLIEVYKGLDSGLTRKEAIGEARKKGLRRAHSSQYIDGVLQLPGTPDSDINLSRSGASPRIKSGFNPGISSQYAPQQTPDELYRRKLGLPMLPQPGYGKNVLSNPNLSGIPASSPVNPMDKPVEEQDIFDIIRYNNQQRLQNWEEGY